MRRSRLARENIVARVPSAAAALGDFMDLEECMKRMRKLEDRDGRDQNGVDASSGSRGQRS